MYFKSTFFLQSSFRMQVGDSVLDASTSSTDHDNTSHTLQTSLSIFVTMSADQEETPPLERINSLPGNRPQSPAQRLQRQPSTSPPTRRSHFLSPALRDQLEPLHEESQDHEQHSELEEPKEKVGAR
jgi:hypothetical protein